MTRPLLPPRSADGAGAEVAAARGLDDRKGIEQHVLEDACGADRPRIGNQLAIQTFPREMNADRGGGADGELKRRGRVGAGMRAAPGVQEQHHPVAPPLLLAADHELAVPGRGAPVHPAQLVAVPVGARYHVVFPGRGGRSGRTVAIAHPAARHHRPGQRHHARRDDERRVRGKRPTEFHQAERVSDPDIQRADHELAAQVGPQRVAELPDAASLDPVQYVPGPGAECIGDGVLGEQQAGGQPRDILQAQGHPGGLSGRDPGRSNAAHAAQPVAGPAGGECGEQRQADQEQPDADQVPFIEQQPGQGRGRARGEKRGTPDGETREQ